MILDIFKTSIYKTSVNNKDYYDFFMDTLNISLNKKEGRIISNVGGFQTKGFTENDFKNKNIFNDLFIEPVSHFLSSFKVKKQIKINNFIFWINKNYPKTFNKLHRHGNNKISGVYYLEVPTQSGSLVFQNGDNIKLSSEVTFDDPNFYSIYTIAPKKFDLILFFSETLHYVQPNFSNEDRISVAFNIDITNN
jgi:uncharacterized protein (TIGR02466 family)